MGVKVPDPICRSGFSEVLEDMRKTVSGAWKVPKPQNLMVVALSYIKKQLTSESRVTLQDAPFLFPGPPDPEAPLRWSDSPRYSGVEQIF